MGGRDNWGWGANWRGGLKRGERREGGWLLLSVEKKKRKKGRQPLWEKKKKRRGKKTDERLSFSRYSWGYDHLSAEGKEEKGVRKEGKGYLDGVRGAPSGHRAHLRREEKEGEGILQRLCQEGRRRFRGAG